MKTTHSYEAVGRNRFRVALSFIALCASAAGCHAADGDACHTGSYKLSDGSVVDIAPPDDDGVRWLRFDGTTGVLHKATSGQWTSTSG